MARSASSLPPLHLAAVRMSEADYVAVNFRLWQARPATRRNHWLLGAAVLLLTISIGLDVWEHGRLETWSTLLFLGVAVAYAALRVGLVRYQLRRGYARNPAAQAPADYTLAADALRGQSADGRFATPWARLKRTVWVGPHWLLLYPTEAACYYLDMRRLQAPATAAEVAQFLDHQQIPQQRL